MQNEVGTNLRNKVKELDKKLSNIEKYIESNEILKFKNSLVRYFNLTKVFQKFFTDNPLSQILDDTNPLSELTHKRRLSSSGVGGLNKKNVKLEVREIHPSHFGRVCPIETSEGKNVGLVLSLAKDIKINNLGFIESPFYFRLICLINL